MLAKVLKFLFVAVLLGCLFFMGVFLDVNAVRSERERRMLEKLPSFTFATFKGEKVEKYIADHIPMREKLLDLYFISGMNVYMDVKNTIVGKDGWLFQGARMDRFNVHNLKSYQNKLILSEKQHQKMVHNLQKIKRWCDENNIKLYLMFPPDKHRIYDRYMPAYILREPRPSLVKQFVSKVPPSINVVPLEDTLRQAAKTSEYPLYYKTESHWAQEGAYLAYLELMKKIEQDFPNVRPLTRDDFYITRVNKVWSPYQLKKKIPMTKGNLWVQGMPYDTNPIYSHYTFKKEKDITVIRDTQFKSSDYPGGAPYHVYIIGDSYGAFLHPFLSATFLHVAAYRFNMAKRKDWGIHFKDRKPEILKNKTDILILSVSDLKIFDLLRTD